MILPYFRWGLFHKPTLRIPKKTHASRWTRWKFPPCGVKFYLKTGKCANLAPKFLGVQIKTEMVVSPLQRLKGIFLELTQQLYLWRSKLSLEKKHIPFVFAGLLFRVSWATAVFVGKSPPAPPRNKNLVGGKALEVAGSWKPSKCTKVGPLSAINGVQ